MVYFSTENGAVNPVRLQKENPGRANLAIEEEENVLRQRAHAKLAARVIDETLRDVNEVLEEGLGDDLREDLEEGSVEGVEEGLEDDWDGADENVLQARVEDDMDRAEREVLEADLEENFEEDSGDGPEDGSEAMEPDLIDLYPFEPQNFLPQSVGRQINIPPEDPMNGEQLACIAKTNEQYQEHELAELNRLKRMFSARRAALHKNADSQNGERDSAESSEQSLRRTSRTPAVAARPDIDPMKLAFLLSRRRGLSEGKVEDFRRAALRQKIRSQAEYVLANDHQLFTDKELDDDLNKSVLLHEFYETCQMPNAAHIAMFADMLGVHEDTIEQWFDDKRKRTIGPFVMQALKEPYGAREQQLSREKKIAVERLQYREYAPPPWF